MNLDTDIYRLASKAHTRKSRSRQAMSSRPPPDGGEVTSTRWPLSVTLDIFLDVVSLANAPTFPAAAHSILAGKPFSSVWVTP